MPTMPNIIDDPLSWQEMVDNTTLPVNIGGAVRFWNTVEHYGLDCIYRDGTPDASVLVFKLAEGLGLELSTSEGSSHIRYRFVEIGPFVLDQSSEESCYGSA